MMKGRHLQKADKDRFKIMADIGCIICRKFLGIWGPCEIHHTDGKTKGGAHQATLGLCFLHHREGSDNQQYTSRHPHKAKFEERYGTEAELLEYQNKLIKEYG